MESEPADSHSDTGTPFGVIFIPINSSSNAEGQTSQTLIKQEKYVDDVTEQVNSQLDVETYTEIDPLSTQVVKIRHSIEELPAFSNASKFDESQVSTQQRLIEAHYTNECPQAGTSSNTSNNMNQSTNRSNSTANEFQHEMMQNSEMTIDVRNLKQEVLLLDFPKQVRIKLKKVTFFRRNFICNICYEVAGSVGDLKIHKIIHNDVIADFFRFRQSFKKMNIERRQQVNLKKNSTENTTANQLTTILNDIPDDKSSTPENPTVPYATEMRHKCNMCTYQCSRNTYLRYHKIMNHAGEKPHKCDVCSRAFVLPVHLKQHKLVHTNDKPYSCKMCPYKCSRLTSLKEHQMNHTGIKPYECDVCSYTFTTLRYLKNHKKVHVEENPFKCDKCSFSCKRSHGLKKHKITHTIERPHKCDVCAFSCKSFITLNTHKITHLSE